VQFKTQRGGVCRRLLVATAVAAIAAISVFPLAGSANAQDEVTSIDYWSPPQAGLNESGTQALLQPLIDGFKAETGITVNVQVVDWSSLLSKITAAIASNTGPDVLAGGNTWNGIYSDTGGVVAWTPEMIEKIGGMSQFVPAFVGTMGYPGKDPVSIPIGGGTWQLVYNKKILADASITEMPKTWDEFIAAAQKTTNPSAGIWGVGSDISNVSNMTTWLWILLRQWGGDFFDPQTGKATVNSDAAVQSVQFFLDWIGKHKIMSPQNAQYNASQAEQDFNNGKLAFLFTQGKSALTLPEDQYGAALLPMREANPPKPEAVMSHVAGENVIILTSSAKQEAAIKWVKYLLSTDVNIEKNLKNGSIPVTLEAAKSDKFSSAVDKIDIEIVENYAQPQPINSDDGPLSQAYARAVGQLAGRVANGEPVTESDIRNALDEVQSAALIREASQN